MRKEYKKYAAEVRTNKKINNSMQMENQKDQYFLRNSLLKQIDVLIQMIKTLKIKVDLIRNFNKGKNISGGRESREEPSAYLYSSLCKPHLCWSPSSIWRLLWRRCTGWLLWPLREAALELRRVNRGTQCIWLWCSWILLSSAGSMGLSGWLWVCSGIPVKSSALSLFSSGSLQVWRWLWFSMEGGGSVWTQSSESLGASEALFCSHSPRWKIVTRCNFIFNVTQKPINTVIVIFKHDIQHYLRRIHSVLRRLMN